MDGRRPWIAATSGGGIPGLAQVALAVLVLSALSGATILVGFHLREQALPIPLAIGHGLIAVAGYILLLVSLFQM